MSSCPKYCTETIYSLIRKDKLKKEITNIHNDVIKHKVDYKGNELKGLLLNINFKDMNVCEAMKTFFCGIEIQTYILAINSAINDNKIKIGNGQNGEAINLLLNFYNNSKNEQLFEIFIKYQLPKHLNKMDGSDSKPGLIVIEQKQPSLVRSASNSALLRKQNKYKNETNHLAKYGMERSAFGSISIGGKNKSRKEKKTKKAKKTKRKQTKKAKKTKAKKTKGKK